MSSTRIVTMAWLLLFGLPGLSFAQGQVGSERAETSAKRTALQVAIHWLSQVDSQQYALSWEGTSPLFQQQVSRKQWQSRAAIARDPLGTLVEREMLGAVYKSNLPGAPRGDYVIFQYEAEFQNKQEAIETLTVSLVDGEWLVSGYFLR